MGSIIKIHNSKGTLYKAVYDLPPYLDGKRRRTSRTFPPNTPRREVVAFLAKASLEKERSVQLSKENCDITFKEWADNYFTCYTQFLSPSTIKGYRSAYENSNPWGLRNYFSDAKMKRIRQQDIQQYVQFLMNAQLSAKSVRNYLILLNNLFGTALKRNIITDNPMRDIQKPILRKKPIDAYSPTEFNLLLKLASEDKNTDIELIVYLGLLSGIRRGEMAALMWQDINWEASSIKIDKCRLVIDAKEYIKPPKTDAGIRTIFVPEQLMAILKKYKLRYDLNKIKYGKDFKDSGYVVSKPNGEPFTPQGIGNNYLRFMKRVENQNNGKKANERVTPRHFHSMRHTYASMLCASGTPVKTVQYNLGHSNVGTTLAIYTHTYVETQREAATKLSSIIAGEKLG